MPRKNFSKKNTPYKKVGGKLLNSIEIAHVFNLPFAFGEEMAV